ncbi:MAG: methyltransferase domain-containing protein [Candidatus Scalindua sp.]|nr:methyltransferase domain-containing protein [Candidatus Scalindua sp.]
MQVTMVKYLFIAMSLWLSCCLSLSADTRRPGRLFPPAKIPVLEEQREWQDIEEIMKRVGIQSGDVVADIGAGSGFFTIPLAEKVGARGLVYAEDIQKGMVDYIAQKVDQMQIENIRVVLGEIDDPALPENTLDYAFMANIYHELEQPLLLLKNVKNDLHLHGKLVIIDWDPRKPSPFGPPKEEKVPEEIVLKEAEEAGFTFVERHEFMPYHYLLLFEKSIINPCN